MGSGENDQIKFDSSNEKSIENDESVNVHFDDARENPSSINPKSNNSTALSRPLPPGLALGGV